MFSGDGATSRVGWWSIRIGSIEGRVGVSVAASEAVPTGGHPRPGIGQAPQSLTASERPVRLSPKINSSAAGVGAR